MHNRVMAGNWCVRRLYGVIFFLSMVARKKHFDIGGANLKDLMQRRKKENNIFLFI